MIEIASGSDHTGNTDFGHGAVVWAFGRGLYAEGWRMRVAGGGGRYWYDGALPAGGAWTPMRFGGDVTVAEALIGRQWRRGALFVKAYAGAQYVEHRVRPRDPSNRVRGSSVGARALVEVWREFGERWWLSADGAYGAAFRDYRAQARLGHRVRPRLSLGVEGGALGNRDFHSGRAGGFARLHLRRIEVTVSGGVADDFFDGDRGFYAAFEMSRKF